MDQDSTGTEDDANAIKDSLYLLDDLSFYFQIGCYTLSAMLAVYLLGMVYEKNTSTKNQHMKGHVQEQSKGGEVLYHGGSVSDSTADFY